MSAANAPLRVAINGHMVGVPADFFGRCFETSNAEHQIKTSVFCQADAHHH
ncbi:hypothetical protein [Secundilactobacillus collinoides]|uniref:hypothetical protein n=1 Tax=Secundilactobacillus collinoides TaxID=33960 RepID=UPI0034E2B7B8